VIRKNPVSAMVRTYPLAASQVFARVTEAEQQDSLYQPTTVIFPKATATALYIQQGAVRRGARPAGKRRWWDVGGR
jgi:hypothetical protein